MYSISFGIQHCCMTSSLLHSDSIFFILESSHSHNTKQHLTPSHSIRHRRIHHHHHLRRRSFLHGEIKLILIDSPMDAWFNIESANHGRRLARETVDSWVIRDTFDFPRHLGEEQWWKWFDLEEHDVYEMRYLIFVNMINKLLMRFCFVDEFIFIVISWFHARTPLNMF